MIEGAIINLRAHEMTDLERMAGWVNDREVTRTLATRYPWSMAAEESWLRDRTSRKLAYGDAGFAIETKDGVHIGSCGLHGASPENRDAELGIMIGEKAYWAKGYGTDALRTLVRFGFEEMNLHRIALRVFAFNARAIASYVTCGFVDEGRMRDARYQEGAYHDVIVMAILREEWDAGEGARV